MRAAHCTNRRLETWPESQYFRDRRFLSVESRWYSGILVVYRLKLCRIGPNTSPSRSAKPDKELSGQTSRARGQRRTRRSRGIQPVHHPRPQPEVVDEAKYDHDDEHPGLSLQVIEEVCAAGEEGLRSDVSVFPGWIIYRASQHQFCRPRNGHELLGGCPKRPKPHVCITAGQGDYHH